MMVLPRKRFIERNIIIFAFLIIEMATFYENKVNINLYHNSISLLIFPRLWFATVKFIAQVFKIQF